MNVHACGLVLAVCGATGMPDNANGLALLICEEIVFYETSFMCILGRIKFVKEELINL